MKQSCPDVEPTLHAARELTGPVPGPILEFDDRENLIHPPLEFGARQTVQPSKEDEVLAGRQVGVDGDVLGHVADRAFLGHALR